jgi:hypothetical protein
MKCFQNKLACFTTLAAYNISSKAHLCLNIVLMLSIVILSPIHAMFSK